MPAQSLRILVLDDDLFLVPRILSQLRAAGHEPIHATTNEQGAALLAEGGFALVLFNLNSARLGGVEALHSLKQSSSARVIARLAHVKIPEAREEILEAGADMIAPNSAVSLRLPSLVEKVLTQSATPTVEDE
jgi:DNA-binding response OmpR family regulator